MNESVPHDDTKTDGKPIISRDGSGRFVSGNRGGPGRGKFIDENGKAVGWADVRAELLREWHRHGATVLDRLRRRSPLAWARLVLGTLAPKSVDVQLGTGDSGGVIELVFQLDKPPAGNQQLETYEAIIAGRDLPIPTQGVAGLPDGATCNGHNTYEQSERE